MTDERVAKVRGLILDVDGVLTDGAVYYGASGEELKRFHVRDGSGLKLWLKAGHRLALVSGRASPAVDRRAAELGIVSVYQGVIDKVAVLDELLAAWGLDASEVAAAGDDLQDLPLLRRVGVAIAVADACSEVRGLARRVTIAPGGHGAVRELVEWLLQAQGRWAALTAEAPHVAAG